MASRKVTKKKPSKSSKMGKRGTSKANRIDPGRIVLNGISNLIRGITQVGGVALMTALLSEDQIEAAGGDLGEAINGHLCGPDCWHAMGSSKEERQAWWDKKMEVNRRARAMREDLRKRVPWNRPPPSESDLN